MWTLSVCIPIYNSDVRTLVNNLCAQIEAVSTAQIEIILIDDASDPAYKALNQFTASCVRLIQLPLNIGRAQIRNLFLQHTNANYLLFIDGDSTILDPQFIEKYSAYLAAQQIDVLIGASMYQNHKPARPQRLRWKYSTQRESLSIEQRSLAIHAGFKTNNFVIRRAVLQRFPFDARLIGYGHEDTLLGLQLTENGMKVEHIDNPVWNLKLDTNAEFLTKTDSALKNLLWLAENYPSLRLFDYNRLLRLHVNLKKNLFLKYLMDLLLLTKPIIKPVLKSGFAPLFIFDAYRLLRLHQLDKHTLHDLH